MHLEPPTFAEDYEKLRRARGYLDDPDERSLHLAGWILLPDRELDSVRVYANGTLVDSAEIEFRGEIADHYPGILHAARSGFRVDLSSGRPELKGIDRIRVVGCQGQRSIAYFESLLFKSINIPIFELPPPRLIYKVQGDHDGDLFRSLGFRYYNQLLEAISRHRDPRSVRRILDWGCGSGRLAAHFLADPRGFEVFGCDLDPDAITWCRQSLQPGEFTQITLSPHLPYPDGTFDIIIALSVLECFGADDYGRWLPELRRVLAPHGLFLASIQGLFAASFALAAEVIPALHRHGILDSADYTPEDREWRGFFLTREFVYREWSKYFDVLDYCEGEINADQDLVVMRLRA
jgi:SAM-dependent methyltransferase